MEFLQEGSEQGSAGYPPRQLLLRSQGEGRWTREALQQEEETAQLLVAWQPQTSPEPEQGAVQQVVLQQLILEPALVLQQQVQFH